jgi:Pyruvate/2-oxoacid:ferredoxin oxidoreductase delta subunit
MSELAYLKIAENVDAGPMTAPKANGDFSPAFIRFLKLLYTPGEAEIVQYLKMPVATGLAEVAESMLSADNIARAAGKSSAEVTDVLDALARKGSVIGFGGNYGLPLMHMLVNQLQFTKEVGPDDLEAGQLYQQFFIKDGFYKYYENSEKGTRVVRVIPVQRTVRPGQQILETEEAHKIIDGVSNLSLVPCPCRTRTEKLGIRECKNDTPVGFCIMMETAALYFQSLGVGRKVTAEQAKKYFDEMQDLGLVGTTENYEEAGHTVICLCCQCCCSQLRGRTRWNNPQAVAPSNFVAESTDECLMCGNCVERCFFGAISLDERQLKSVVDAEKCMGCGVCAITCDQEALRLKRVEREKPLPTASKLLGTIAAENQEGRKRIGARIAELEDA